MAQKSSDNVSATKLHGDGKTQLLSLNPVRRPFTLGAAENLHSGWLSSYDTTQKKAHRIMHIETRQLQGRGLVQNEDT